MNNHIWSSVWPLHQNRIRFLFTYIIIIVKGVGRKVCIDFTYSQGCWYNITGWIRSKINILLKLWMTTYSHLPYYNATSCFGLGGATQRSRPLATGFCGQSNGGNRFSGIQVSILGIHFSNPGCKSRSEILLLI